MSGPANYEDNFNRKRNQSLSQNYQKYLVISESWVFTNYPDLNTVSSFTKTRQTNYCYQRLEFGERW